MIEKFTCCKCGDAEEFSGADWADCVWFATDDGWCIEGKVHTCPSCCEEESYGEH